MVLLQCTRILRKSNLMKRPMKHVRNAVIPLLILVVLTATAEKFDSRSGMAAWEQVMHADRPYLPPKAARTLRTLEASASVSNGGSRNEAWSVAERTLGSAFAEEASWQTTFRTAEERIDVAEHVSSSGVHSRFAVYGQNGNHVPYYWIADGLAASGQADLAAFLKGNGIVVGSSSVSVADGVLSADETRIAGRGEEITAPYARFHFAFVDDSPGANWAHPCRYVFVSEDFSSFTILYKRWMPRLSVRRRQVKILFCADQRRLESLPERHSLLERHGHDVFDADAQVWRAQG